MKPVFYAINTRQQISEHGCAISLQAACERRGIQYERLVTDEISLSDTASLKLAPNSLLYRISTAPRAQMLESQLVLSRPGNFTTIYHPKSIQLPTRPFHELTEQIAAGLQIIPTIIIDELWAGFNADELTSRMAPLGGFPVVIKMLGLAHGQGVQKLDSAADLQQLLQKTNWRTSNYIARRYLADYRHYRLIVVADTVSAAIEYHKPEDDFRTNATESPNVTAVAVETLSPEMIELAVAGTKLRSSLLGGVDILVDQVNGVPYLAEVNVPCYFARAEGPTGIDIAGQIVDAMVAKQKMEATL